MEENQNTQNSVPAPEAGAPQQPSAARTSEQIKDELLKNASELEDNTEWWKRDAILQKRQALYAELDTLSKPKQKAPQAANEPEDTDELLTDQQASPEGQGYELTVDDTITGTNRDEAAAFAGDVGQLGRDAGLSHDTTQSLFDLVADLELTDTSGVNGSNPDETMTVLSNRYGAAAAKQLVADCQSAVKRLGPAIRQYLDQPLDAMGARLGNAPSVIVALAHLHRGDLNLTPAQAQSEVTKLRRSKGYTAGDRAIVDRVRVLSRIATRGQKNELKGPSHAVPNTKSQGRKQVENKIAELRRSPAYFDRSRPEHREVVAQVQALYSQLSEG
jgi:hypothetical protein